MSVQIAGISIGKFPQSKNPNVESAKLLLLFPLDDVQTDKFTRKAVGVTTDVPFGKQAIQIKASYAHELIDKRAFSPLKEYELRFEFNSDTFENEVIEIIPVDPKLAQHFKDSGMVAGK